MGRDNEENVLQKQHNKTDLLLIENNVLMPDHAEKKLNEGRECTVVIRTGAYSALEAVLDASERILMGTLHGSRAAKECIREREMKKKELVIESQFMMSSRS